MISESKQRLYDVFERFKLGASRAEIDRLMKPSIGFSDASRRWRFAKEAPALSGLSQLGGLPRLPEGAEWPYRSALPHASEFESWWPHKADLPSVWSSRQPMTFIAELDLAGAARVASDAGWPLPREGRLQLFWEPLCGCFGQGRLNAHVAWDQTPPSETVKLEFPVEDFPTEIAGLPPVLPEQRLAPKLVWSLPDLRSEKFAVLTTHAEDEGLLSEFEYVWSGEGDSDGLVFTGETYDVRTLRMLGWSTPLQSDPAYYANAQALGFMDFPVRWDPVPDDQLSDTLFEDWLMLLQVSLSHLEQTVSTGMVYFMIRRDDAKARRFDQTIAVYQQT